MPTKTSKQPAPPVKVDKTKKATSSTASHAVSGKGAKPGSLPRIPTKTPTPTPMKESTVPAKKTTESKPIAAKAEDTAIAAVIKKKPGRPAKAQMLTPKVPSAAASPKQPATVKKICLMLWPSLKKRQWWTQLKKSNPCA